MNKTLLTLVIAIILTITEFINNDELFKIIIVLSLVELIDLAEILYDYKIATTINLKEINYEKIKEK